MQASPAALAARRGGRSGVIQHRPLRGIKRGAAAGREDMLTCDASVWRAVGAACEDGTPWIGEGLPATAARALS
jgi:hypothetical protein